MLAWAPGLTGVSNRADRDAGRETVEPEKPVLDAFGELDLVVTPVSVTPPRTWRRAAWFAVGASCVVLTVLVFAAARLAGPGSAVDRVDAFHGLPTGGLLTPQPLGPPVQADPDSQSQQAQPGAGGQGGPASNNGPDAASGGAERPQGGGQGEPRGGGPAAPGTTATNPGGSGGGTVSSPTVSMLPSTGRPAVTADDMVSATRSFYDNLPGDIDAAWQMVGPRVKVRGYENFRRPWADAADVQLQGVVVDADGSTVIATVQVVRKNGTSTVERYELTFRRSSSSVVIDDLVPMDQAIN